MRAVHILCLALMLGATAGCSVQSPTMPGPETASVDTGSIIGAILEEGVTAQVNVAAAGTVAAGDDVKVAQENKLKGKQQGITLQANVALAETVVASDDVRIYQRNDIKEDNKNSYESRKNRRY